MSSAESSVSAQAEDAIVGGEDVTVPGVAEAAGDLAGAFGQSHVVIRETLRLGQELTKIALGISDVAPAKGDRRFSDPAWTVNPFYHRIEQTYLASAHALEDVVNEWRKTVKEPSRAEGATFAANIVASAMSPTNYLPTNPAALREAFDTAGLSLVRGARNFASDVRHNSAMPQMVEPDAFEVGRELALTPGAVISRDEVAEVIQYAPTTETVHERPVLVIPPPIGRFYFLDLQPGRSFVEYGVSRGIRMFMLSWRNPQPEQGDWDLDTYARRISDAIDEVREVTGSDDVNLIGFCAGGIITTTLLNHLAAHGDTRVHSMSYAVTMLDFEDPAMLGAFSGHRLVEFAKSRSRRKGIISAQEMGSAFTWMRPDDLVFNYVVNNYLMGRKPPAFDILAWNADGTNLPGALHGQFLDIFAHNLLIKPNAMTVLGTPIDLNQIKVPTFVSGAIADHLTVWKNCYRTTHLLGGDATFVLSYSGHIASLVNPPGNPKAHYWVDGEPGPDPQAWLDAATRKQGSWWEPWADWASEEHGGRKVPAVGELGSDQHKPLCAAPGLYVRDQLPDEV